MTCAFKVWPECSVSQKQRPAYLENKPLFSILLKLPLVMMKAFGLGALTRWCSPFKRKSYSAKKRKGQAPFNYHSCCVSKRTYPTMYLSRRKHSVSILSSTAIGYLHVFCDKLSVGFLDSVVHHDFMWHLAVLDGDHGGPINE